MIVLHVLIDLIEFTGYPGNKNDCAHCSASDKVEFVAQPWHIPLLFLPVAQKMHICVDEVKVINVKPERICPKCHHHTVAVKFVNI